MGFFEKKYTKWFGCYNCYRNFQLEIPFGVEPIISNIVDKERTKIKGKFITCTNCGSKKVGNMHPLQQIPTKRVVVVHEQRPKVKLWSF